MKNIFSTLFLFLVIILSAQKQNLPKDIVFDTPIFETEKQWVLLPPKDENSTILFAVMLYYDQYAGYTLELGETFDIKNGNLIKQIREDLKTGSTKVRWSNLKLKVAKLSDQRLKEFKIEKNPEWLSNYYDDTPTDEDLVDRYSRLNGSGLSDIALPKLEELQKQKFKSAKFYFELAYAYNALGKFSEAEKVIEEANKNGFNDELLIKEMLYATNNLGNLDLSAKYLLSNLDKMKTQLFKDENIANMIVHFFKKNRYKDALEWVQIYRKNLPKDARYYEKVEELEKLIIKEQNAK